MTETMPDARDLATALDALIPGNADWPAASLAVDPMAVFAALGPADRAWLAPLPDWKAVEHEPAFARLMTALNTAYYSSPAVAPRLRALAEAGPRDPSPTFDLTLLNTRKLP